MSSGNRNLELALRIRMMLEGAESVEDLRSGMEGLADEMEQAGQEAKNAGREIDGIDDSSRKAGAGAKEAAGSLGDLKDVLAGIITLAAAKQILDLNDRLVGLKRGFETVIGSSEGADQALQFVNKTAERLGVNALDLAQAFLKITASAKGTQLEGAPTEKIFTGIAAAMSTVNASGEDLERVMDAVGQMMGKGVVSAEELRGQLGDSLPGAVQQAAQALMVSNAELSKMLESGEVIAADFLPKFAAQLEKTMGGGGKQVEGFTASWNRLTNQLIEIATGPAGQGFTVFVAGLIDKMGTLTRGLGFASDLIGSLGQLIGGIAAGEVSAALDDFGQSAFEATLNLIGLKSEAQQAAERQKQIAEESKATTIAIDALQNAVARGELKALPEHLQAAMAELKKTGDAAAATEQAISKLMAAPAQNLSLDGILDLATSIKAVAQDAKGAGAVIASTLGQQLSKLTDEQLVKLEEQARKAMAAAGDDQNARQVFADLGQILEGVVLARLERLGVDGKEAMTGISDAAADALDDFNALATNAEIGANAIEKAFEGALAKLDSPEEVEKLKQKIIDLGNDGKLSGEQIERALLLIRQRAQDVADDPAFDALADQLAKIREETDREADAGERAAKTKEIQIEAALRLANAKGDEAAAAKLAAQAAQEEVDRSRERIAQLKEQTTQIGRHIQLLYARANADGQYSDAERDVIEALKEKVAQMTLERQQIEANLPLQQRAAEQAERMAGPLGQLIRLYEQKTAAAGRETDAIERGYDAKIRDLEVEQQQAEAKGDTAKAAEIGIQIKQEEAAQAQALADAKRVELQAEIDLIEAQKLAIPIDEQITTQGKEKVAGMDAQIAKLRDLIDAEQDKADSAKALADAEKQRSDVFDTAAQNAYKFSDAQSDVAKRNEEVGQSTDRVVASTETLSIAMAKFRGETALAFAGPGMSRYNELINDIKSTIERATDAARELATQGLSAGTEEAEQLIQELDASNSALNDMAHGAAQDLRQALEDARREAEEMKQSLIDAADSFEQEILRIQGNKKALLDREYQDDLKHLEEMRQKAGQDGEASYQDAKARADELHRLKMQQLAEEDAAKRKQESSGGNTSSAAPSGGGGGGAPGGGGGVTNVTNNFYTDPTQLTTEEWIRRNVIPTIDNVTRLRK